MVDFTPPAPFDPSETPAPLPATVALNPPMIGLANPFFTVDGQNRDDIVEALRVWSRESLLPWAAAWQEYLAQFPGDTATWLNAYVTSFQSYLAASLDEQNETVTAALEQAVQLLVTNSILVQDPVVTGMINDVNSNPRKALDALYVDQAQRIRSRGVLPMYFIEKIGSWSRYLTNKDNPVMTIVGDSIPEGVGTDNTSDGVSYADFREYAWPVIVNRVFGRMRGVRPAPGFVGAASAFGFTNYRTGSPTIGTSYGPIGNYGSDNTGSGGLDRRRGGIGLTGATLATWANDPTETGFFNNVIVCSFGTDSGLASPRTFGVDVDGVEKIARPTVNANQTGNVTYTTLTNLGNTRHTVTVKGGGASGNTPFFGIIPFNDRQVIVNRIAAAGAKSRDLIGYGLTGADAQRVIDSTILYGLTDCLGIAIGYNDGDTLTDPVARAEMKANIQTLITRHLGGNPSNTVVLFSPPPGSNKVDTQVYYELANENARTAYIPMHLLFGARPQAYLDGLFPTQNTVHPSRYGHRLMGTMAFNTLPEPSVN